MQNSGEIELATLPGVFNGSPAAIYPQMQLVASRTWDWPVWITACQFSTSLTIYPTEFGGLVLTLGKIGATNIAVSPGLASVIAHITAPNSSTGFPAPSSKVSNISFGGCGYYLNARTPLSIYGFAEVPAVDVNVLFAVCSIQYRRANS